MVIRYLLFVFLISVVLVGCGSEQAVVEPVAVEAVTAQVESAAQVEVEMGVVFPPDTPADNFRVYPVQVPLPGVTVVFGPPEAPVVEMTTLVLPEVVVPEVVEGRIGVGEQSAPEVAVVEVTVPFEVSPGESALPSAVEVLEAMGTATAGVNTGSYELEVTTQVEAEGLEVPVSLKIWGDYQKPDRQKIVGEVGASFFKIRIEMVAIGDVLYVKDPITNEWEVQDAEESSTGGFHEFTTGFQSLDLAAYMTVVEESVVEDRAVFSLEGDVPVAVFGELVGEDDIGVGSMQVKYVVGVEDHLLYRAEVGSVDEDGVVTTVSMRFFDYGKEVDIQAPEGF